MILKLDHVVLAHASLNEGLAARLARLGRGGAALAFRHDDLDALAARAREAGFATRGPEAWSRRGADGETLNWRLLFVTHPALHGADPFFIDWGDTPHPSTRLRAAAQLLDCALQAPDPDLAGAALHGLGLALKLSAGDPPALQITLATGQMTARIDRPPVSLF